MQAELSTWRSLWDSAAVLFVLGIAGGLSSCDRGTWWLSQGLLVLSVVIGFAAASATHTDVDLFSLSIWVPIACGLSWLSHIRIRPSSTVSVTSHDRSL